MPYIKQQRRRFIEGELDLLAGKLALIDTLNAGDMNYIFTYLSKVYLQVKGEKYQNYNDLMGALEGCKIELYRRSIAPYEDAKIYENGDLK